MIQDLLGILDNCDDPQDKFEILHSALNQVEELSFKNGYRTALADNVQNLMHVINNMDEEDCNCDVDMDGV